MLPVLLIMVLPEAMGIAVAADSAWPLVTFRHPAWLSIEWPVLIMLGCISVGLSAWARKFLTSS